MIELPTFIDFTLFQIVLLAYLGVCTSENQDPDLTKEDFLVIIQEEGSERLNFQTQKDMEEAANRTALTTKLTEQNK